MTPTPESSPHGATLNTAGVGNPLKSITWTEPRKLKTVDPPCVLNPEQARRFLSTTGALNERGKRLKARTALCISLLSWPPSRVESWITRRASQLCPQRPCQNDRCRQAPPGWMYAGDTESEYSRSGVGS